MRSSTSFMIARKGPLTDRLRDAMVQFVEEVLLGDVLEKESIPSLYRWQIRRESRKKKALAAFKRGWTVSGDTLNFELEDDSISWTYHELLRRLEEADPEHFRVIWHNLDEDTY